MSDNLANLLILGAGQYSYVIEEIARLSGRFQDINCLDDVAPIDQRILGRIEDAEHMPREYSFAVAAIGNPQKRRALTHKLLQCRFRLPILIHPCSWVSCSATLSPGCVVEAHAVINANAFVGMGSFICAGAVVNHNTVIGDFCQIDCNSTVPARSRVQDETKVNCGMVFVSEK